MMMILPFVPMGIIKFYLIVPYADYEQTWM